LDIELIINQLFSGLVRSALYFLVTSGLSLLFGVVGVLNMSHFSFYMLASYITWTFSRVLLGYNFSFVIALVLAALSMCAFAWIIERLFFRYLYKRLMPEQLLITFSIIYIVDDLSKVLWGATPLYISKPLFLTQALTVGGISFPMAGIFVLVLGIVIGLGTWLLLTRTRLGRILRAAYSYKEMISCLGIPIKRIYLAMFVLSVLLVSVAGSAWTLVGMVDLGQGHAILIECFCVMVIGGMGSFAGTAIASLLVGLTYSFAILFVPKMATLLIFCLAGVILTFKPWGLMGTVGRMH
jgi:branched-chain amino acid transport system permease protein